MRVRQVNAEIFALLKTAAPAASRYLAFYQRLLLA
jgi:hypothetical protein